MKNKPELWKFTQKDKTRWFYTGKPECSQCKKEIYMGYYFTNWNKNNFFSQLLCESCTMEQTKINMHMQEIKVVLVCVEPPHNSIPIQPSYPNLTAASNNDVFSAADKNLSGEVTKDKTRLAGRAKQVEVEYVGDPRALEHNEQENKHLRVDEFDSLLGDLQNSTPVIGDQETKRIEVDENEDDNNNKE